MIHASVFSGIGGPEIAATMLGWENVFHCEINPFGKAVLDYWYPNSRSYEDITKTDFSEWRGRVDVLTGGFPCQPFSYAGQRRGADDDRYLWPHMFRCIDQIQPTWVVAENVAGILTMVEQGEVSPMESQGNLFDEVDGVPGYRLRETFTLQRICDDLEGHGYEVQPVLVPACAVGAPPRRDRVFIIGRRLDTAEWRTSTNPTNDGGSRNTASASQSAQRPNGQSNEQSAISGSIRDAQRTHADTKSEQGERLRPEQSEVGRATQEQSGGRSGEDGSGTHTTHTDCHRGCEVDEHMESELADGAKPVSNGGQRNVADTSDIGARKCEQAEREECGRPSLSEFRERYGASLSADGGVCGERWQNFPSVSPVHRGNDGLPFDVDYLTIPFYKWRTESLKAYGNAIVPQVMYEIFRAIEITTRQQ